MEIQENIALKPKTTMRIGGNARYFAEPHTKGEVTKAWEFAKEKGIPFIVLGGGSNTIFEDSTINALVIRIKHDELNIQKNTVTVGASKNLPMLLNELAKEGLDLSPLTGILGTVGGAVFGNAGQGPKGIWIDTYIETVDVFVEGEWRTMQKSECDFHYRESIFKEMNPPPIIWSTQLLVPTKPTADIQAEIEQLLQKRIETQPHIKTAGSCFKAVGDTPAWQLIDAAGLRETSVGGVHIAEKHANFLINNGEATFADAVSVVDTITKNIPEGLEVEMRFIKSDGSLEY